MTSHEVISTYHRLRKIRISSNHPTYGEARELIMRVIYNYGPIISSDEIADHLFADNINVVRGEVKAIVRHLVETDRLKYNKNHFLEINYVDGKV